MMQGKPASVVQDWLSDRNISWKQQTVVLSALRGCDGQSKHDRSKQLTRMIRSAVLRNAGTDATSFMRDGMSLDDVRAMAEDSDKYPLHYYAHAMHACEIIGYKHPDPEIANWFQTAYRTMVDALHLLPETPGGCDVRLRDGVDTPFTEIDPDPAREYAPDGGHSD